MKSLEKPPVLVLDHPEPTLAQSLRFMGISRAEYQEIVDFINRPRARKSREAKSSSAVRKNARRK